MSKMIILDALCAVPQIVGSLIGIACSILVTLVFAVLVLLISWPLVIIVLMLLVR